jgi:hypothetical protein
LTLTAISDDDVVSWRGEDKEPTRRRVVLTLISRRVPLRVSLSRAIWTVHCEQFPIVQLFEVIDLDKFIIQE